ncbi:sigma-70 family RNA polymerase sigma factor [Pelomonas sp. CA6]|uniref:RNA polymerase sigma factor n=1 Tax=Pelomonas sp. CA6 TaxID=2907999 RepID=UPI001F4BD6B1|nr:sigma-70 family RNA polymerase sigma factor [Pelomonas sp. CA6]MCH7343394.1 sigma-70 family RNA polymerase sigma factor [Pelomonas sp. CA6]
MSTAADAATGAAIAAVWRLESARIVASVTRLTRDLGLAEDAAQDALVAALEHWPREGLPDKPGAWLLTAARNKALDRLRHGKLSDTRLNELGLELEAREAMIVPDFVDGLDDARRQRQLGDDVLRLIFCSCHPVLSREARVALTLKLVAGLSTAEIARAFLQSEPTVAQRLVRAKKTLAGAGVPFDLPQGEALQERLAAVLEVVYLVFNEGYTATEGEDWLRTPLCDEALRLARMLTELVPTEPEVHGLAALLELQASRNGARVDAQGRPVLLMAQDRQRWDRLLIRRGLAALAQAQALAAPQPPGPYALQAEIAACHARAAQAQDTDWARILALYGELEERQPSPVIALNRVVALSMAQGPGVALHALQPLLADPVLARYPWLPSVHADLLQRLGRHGEARAELLRAATLTANVRERELLQARAAALDA